MSKASPTALAGACGVVLSALAVPLAGAPFADALAAAAIERTRYSVVYDGAYQVIPYPGGDVAADRGVCTDVIIRAYRALDIDLQRRVHEDMRADFDAYPARRIWSQRRPDPNIDHRRVPNLMAFFARHGTALAITSAAHNYRAGDVVTWMLPGNLPHIGIVTARQDAGSGRPLVVHNIGEGPKLEDVLFRYRVTGHYRYHPSNGRAPRGR